MLDRVGLGRIQGDIERVELAAVGNERDEPRVGQVRASCESQAFNTFASSQGHDAPVVEACSEGGEVQAPDEIAVGEVGILEGESLADGLVIVPCRARRAVPENLDGVARPPLAGQDDVQEIRGAAELAKDGHVDLVR
jgi:hypothetical protein